MARIEYSDPAKHNERTRELLAMNNELERTMAQRQQLEAVQVTDRPPVRQVVAVEEEGRAAAELAQLVFAITAINAWNRLLITARTEPGHYQPRVREVA